MDYTGADRFFKKGRLLIRAIILFLVLLLVPPVIVFCDREQTLFSFTFLIIESGVCAFGMFTSLIICHIIAEKKASFFQEVIGPDDLLRPLRYALYPSFPVGFGAVMFISIAAAFVVEHHDLPLWLGFPSLSWFMAVFGLIFLIVILVMIIIKSRAMNRIRDGLYTVYLAEFTRGDYKIDSDGPNNEYYLFFEKAEDTRPRVFTTYDYGTYLEAKPGDRYYLLIVGNDIVNALRADRHVLCEEFKDRLIREHGADGNSLCEEPVQ